MKNYWKNIITLFLLFFIQISFSQKTSYFKVIDNKIVFISQKESFFFLQAMKKEFSKYSFNEKIIMANELLKYEGYTTICTYPFYCNSLISNQIFNDKDKSFTIQVEALYIINLLFYDNAFDLYPYTILRTNKDVIVHGKNNFIMKKIFNAYKIWLIKVKKNKRINKFESPLSNTDFSWYF